MQTEGNAELEQPSNKPISKMSVYKIALATRNLEINLFWQRCNYFLVLNSGLAYGFFALSERESFRIPVAALGMVVCLLWYRVALGSKFWQERWEHRLRMTETDLIERKLFDQSSKLFSANVGQIRNEVRDSLRQSRHTGIERLIDEQVLKKPSVTLSMIYLVLTFGVSWMGLFVYEAFDFLT